MFVIANIMITALKKIMNKMIMNLLRKFFQQRSLVDACA